MKFQWESSCTDILINPRLSEDQKTFIQKNLSLHDFPDHMWIASSGSTAKTAYDHKFTALSKKAILSSAAAVNKHLQAVSEDVWLSSLPTFHVGGVGIYARAYLSNSRVISMEKWDPDQFTGLVTKNAVTLTSLVPTQVFDLVAKRLKAPSSLRAIIVGGGALNSTLKQEAEQLGWPLLPSYGLTECASQVATATRADSSLQLLSHIEAKQIDGRIAIKSPALLTAYALMSFENIQIVDPKIDEWYLTHDCGEISDGVVYLHGRQDDFIKIGGESVMLTRLQELFEQAKLSCSVDYDAAIFPMPDERLGVVIHLVTTKKECDFLCESYNQRVMPFERIRKVHVMTEIPRSALNKLLLQQLLALLGETNSC